MCDLTPTKHSPQRLIPDLALLLSFKPKRKMSSYESLNSICLFNMAGPDPVQNKRQQNLPVLLPALNRLTVSLFLSEHIVMQMCGLIMQVGGEDHFIYMRGNELRSNRNSRQMEILQNWFPLEVHVF